MVEGIAHLAGVLATDSGYLAHRDGGRSETDNIGDFAHTGVIEAGAVHSLERGSLAACACESGATAETASAAVCTRKNGFHLGYARVFLHTELHRGEIQEQGGYDAYYSQNYQRGNDVGHLSII